MLTPQLKNEANKMLQKMYFELEFDQQIKSTLKSNIDSINHLANNFKNDPKKQKKVFQEICNHIGPKILQQQQIIQSLLATEQNLRYQKQQIIKQKKAILDEKEKIELSVEQIKQTIQKIRSSVQQSIQYNAQKRKNITDQLQKSLNQIHDKILLFEKESEEAESSNQIFRAKKREIEQKLSSLEIDFRKKAELKDEEVKKQKDELMNKLQSLQGQVSEVTELNKEYSSKQKNNFDRKLSLYLKTKKFPEYSNSFQNSARTIDQCKQQFLKGIQRMNDAMYMIRVTERETEQFLLVFTNDSKKKEERQAKIQSLKKQKEVVRDRIIALQNKIKEQKIKMSDSE